jgi:hypothetical protein
MTTTGQDGSRFLTWERCVLALAILGGRATAVQVRDFLEREDDLLGDLAVVSRGLRYAGYVAENRAPLVEIVNPGQGKRNVYRLTDAGRSWVAQVGGPDS